MGRFQARICEGGKWVNLGSFGTAVEAAVAYARHVEVEEAAEEFEVDAEDVEPDDEAEVVEEAEGLRLHTSGRRGTSTGYKCVYPYRRRFKVLVDGSSLGVYDTAVEAAVAYARHAGPPSQPQVATEAEGLRLHLSKSNSTGYKYVYRAGQGKRFVLRLSERPHVVLGYFDTAVEAAVAYARYVESGGMEVDAEDVKVDDDGVDGGGEDVVEEAEGLRLHLSSNNGTGYKGVTNIRGRFQAKVRELTQRTLDATPLRSRRRWRTRGTCSRSGRAARRRARRRPRPRDGAGRHVGRRRRRARQRARHRTRRRRAAPAPATVRAFLAKHNLEEYADAFDAEGYDDFDYLLEVGRSGRAQIEEVAANVRMTKPGHVAKFCHYLGQLARAESGL